MRGRLLHKEVLVDLDITDLNSYIRAGPMQFFGGTHRCPYFPPVVVLLRACVGNEAGPPESWTEEQVIEGERERERDARLRMGKETHRNGPSMQKTQVESETEQGARIYIYLRVYVDYTSGYNRSGRRNRCRCLFANALRGYDGGTAGSTRAFLEAARASQNLQKEARENDRG